MKVRWPVRWARREPFWKQADNHLRRMQPSVEETPYWRQTQLAAKRVCFRREYPVNNEEVHQAVIRLTQPHRQHAHDIGNRVAGRVERTAQQARLQMNSDQRHAHLLVCQSS